MEPAGSERLAMAISLKRKTFRILVNVLLVLVALSAWAASENPEHSAVIAVSTALLSSLFSLITLRFVQIDQTDESTSILPKTPVQEEENTAAELPSPNSEEWRSELLSHYRSIFLARPDWPSYRRDLVSRSLHSRIIYPYMRQIRPEDAKVSGSSGQFHIEPHDPENYTVRVGLVTVSVRAGRTDIHIDSKPEAGHRHSDDKIDVILRPDLSE
jgi:hypothetical protein